MESAYQTMFIGDRDSLSLTVVTDALSIEIFINEGEYVMTNQVFPNEPYTKFEERSTQGSSIKKMDIKRVKNIL